MFKIVNKDTRVTSVSIVNFEQISHNCSGTSIADFEQANADWNFYYTKTCMTITRKQYLLNFKTWLTH